MAAGPKYYRESVSTPCHTPMTFAHEIIIEEDDKKIEGQCYEHYVVNSTIDWISVIALLLCININ
jgi:hypothetical protein